MRALSSALQLGLCLSLLLAPARAASPAAQTPTESQLKAAFLLNFARFVTWPSHVFESADTPLVFGIVADPRLASDLESILRERGLDGRPVVVRPAPTWRDLPACHIVHFAANADWRLAEALQSLHTAGTLTTGEIDGFARRGGVIHLVRDGTRLRFEVNLASASTANLRVHAQLLRLAQRIHRAPNEPSP
ncbi:MAG: YfiR family protein [Verrucomicrobiae bacterium]|nr:YfiR family protein [Verrucomicrobiae bacterium]